MIAITYQPNSKDDFLIYEDGKRVGNLYCRRDIFNDGATSFHVQIAGDRRGAHPVPSGCSIDATVNLVLDTHPLFS